MIAQASDAMLRPTVNGVQKRAINTFIPVKKYTGPEESKIKLSYYESNFTVNYISIRADVQT